MLGGGGSPQREDLAHERAERRFAQKFNPLVDAGRLFNFLRVPDVLLQRIAAMALHSGVTPTAVWRSCCGWEMLRGGARCLGRVSRCTPTRARARS